jgi:photosystem II stability/assembly factor-like uncharacterized protein
MRKLLILTVLLFIALPLRAEWRRAGLYGADVRALVVDPSSPDTIYLGTSKGEVYRTTDGGKRWANPRGGVPFPGYTVDNLVIDASGRLWAAAWGIWGGGVIAVSTDGGVTWSRRDGGLEAFSVRALAVDPQNGETLVAGGLDGVWHTRNSGRSWRRISKQENVESVAIDPRSPETIYIGTWRQGWRTDDGGKTWKHIAEGMVLDTDIFAIHVDAANPDSLWLATCGWVYTTENRGDKWVRFKEGFNNRRIHDITLDPKNSNVVLAGSVAGLYRSPDKGKTWSVITSEDLVINAIGVHPERPRRIVLGTEGDGVYISNDGGKSFQRSSEGLHNVKVAAIVADPSRSDLVYAAVMFGGTASGVYRSEDAGRTWGRLSTTRMPEILTLVVTGGKQRRFLAGTENGFYTSGDGVEWRRVEPSMRTLRVEKIVRYGEQRLFAATSDGVYTTRDAGDSWSLLSSAPEKTVDMAVARYGGKPALFALKNSELLMFDGREWSVIKGAPGRGMTLATARDAEDLLVIAGPSGVRAGKIREGAWVDEASPVEAGGAVYFSGVEDGLYLAARNRSGIYVREGKNGWKSLGVPLGAGEISSIIADPFLAERLYIATHGYGIYVWDQRTSRLVSREASQGPPAATK